MNEAWSDLIIIVVAIVIFVVSIWGFTYIGKNDNKK